MKKHFMNNWKKIVVYSVVGIVLLYAAIFFSNSINKVDLNCATVNEENGDIAISYSDGDYTVIKLYDKYGNEKFIRRIDNAGGSVHNLFFDGDHNLHVPLGRIGIEKIYDQNGNEIETISISSTENDYWNSWDKKGSSYSKQIGNVIYCYDYANFIEMIWKPVDKFYIQNGNDVITIWSSKTGDGSLG